GVAGSGAGAGLLSLSANVIADTVKAGIMDETIAHSDTGSAVKTAGAVTISAEDSSTIDAIAFGVSGSGGAAIGAALSANVITNKIETFITGSTLGTGSSPVSSLSMTAESSAVIRSVTLGVSGSGGFALQVTGVGNIIADTITSIISNSTVNAKNAITVTATDSNPGTPNELETSSAQQTELDNDTASSPTSLGSILGSANIVSVVVGVAGSGLGAVNVTLVGNSIANTVKADITGSTINSTSGGVDLEAHSSAEIVAITAGVAGSGGVSVNATGLGNAISNTVEASILGGSTVAVGGSVIQKAQDSSSISSIGLSFAGSGGLAAAAIVAVNDIGNTLSADINSSRVSSGSAVQLSAISSSNISSFVGGIAGAGIGAANLSLAVSEIHNNIDASIISSPSVHA